MFHCGTIVPRQTELVRDYKMSEYIAECILPAHHACEHAFKTPDGRNFVWEYDYGCDCCEPEESDRCTLYSELTEEEFREFLRKNNLELAVR